MALNRFMHPRNPYKEKKPDFKSLALKYEEFRKHAIQDLKGEVHLDFKKPECLQVLSWAILKEDMDLDVYMPLNRLIPTIPLRMNYILWLEDILRDSFKDSFSGIDIGTGASCIYSLIGAKTMKWDFLSLEVDDFNYECAKRNVTKNNLENQIKVLKIEVDAGLPEVLNDITGNYDFSMCNPPFFGSNMEAWGMQNDRNDDRPAPSSVSTASPIESVYPGGEVQFVQNMIADSLLIKNRVRVFTSMLGKKNSLSILKYVLAKNEITNVGITEFCQGRTMRWGIAWSFDPTVKFPKPPSKAIKSVKSKAPLVLKIPGTFSAENDQPGIECAIESVFEQLQGETEVIEKSRSWFFTAKTDTWSNQRRKRRLVKHQMQDIQSMQRDTCECPEPKKIALGIAESKALETKHDLISCGQNLPEKCALSSDEVEQADSRQDTFVCRNKDSSDECPRTNEHFQKNNDEQQPLLKCKILLTKCDDNCTINFVLEEGSRECMHQVVQYFKNKMK